MSVLVGKEAPDFTAQAVMPDNSIKAEYNLKKETKGKYAVLFFWPLDFTFVCPSEIIAFDNRVSEFKKLGAEVIGISVDSQYTHYAWKNTPVDKGGIGNVQFPLIADLTKSIARSYDLLTGDAVAFRGTFIVDKAGKVRHQLVNDLPLGRNVDETIRTLEALIFHEEHGEVCPANWKKGAAGMKPTADGVAAYLKDHAKAL
jgi:peroxiredoxin (alkyl hydroperoxide reductase subunit C)